MKHISLYQSTTKKLSGTTCKEVYKKAFALYTTIKKQSKRRVYIRSTYFKGEKIFLALFWHHLQDKHHKERVQRLKYFPCALDLLRTTTSSPISIKNNTNTSEILHRFAGSTIDNEFFFVQVKEHIISKQKYFISVFPVKKQKTSRQMEA